MKHEDAAESQARLYGHALELACKDMHAAKRFCPRYHGLYRCSDRLCPQAGSEWTCWFEAYLEKAAMECEVGASAKEEAEL